MIAKAIISASFALNLTSKNAGMNFEDAGKPNQVLFRKERVLTRYKGVEHVWRNTKFLRRFICDSFILCHSRPRARAITF